MQKDRPVLGIAKEKISIIYVPLSLAHSIVFPTIPGMTVTLSCEV